MNTRERIIEAAYELAEQRPSDQIRFADVAKAAGVHWTAVRRHFGSREDMRRQLTQWQTENGRPFADTRTRILEAAARVFAEQGYAGATLDHVAAEAGLTKGAVYWHFSGKSDLFLALCERTLNAQLRTLPGRTREAVGSPDPAQALTRLLAEAMACCEPGSSQPLLFFEFVVSSREPAVKEKLRKAYGNILDGTEAFLKPLRDGGMLDRNADPQALSILFQALINGLTLAWIIDPDRVRFDRLLPQLSRILWEGLKPENA
ncbi:TetR/AcrR family transcriptional regulator [Paenibacillus thermoaerophilus]|uniref:TetR/AcrR family transcriptional regulator n=1 Tax=Paenibacillus thermoaerophilus TaxID=1215385 RepID=A0ABW2V4P1_9BACL|nr:TetR/AcrR family transcriptional regulator [Paenibacillus thermoaerophilus]TMV18384.1 helix-turn-helix transcriptional regulator [Paenibacillus thermoaerophilus]